MVDRTAVLETMLTDSKFDIFYLFAASFVDVDMSIWTDLFGSSNTRNTISATDHNNYVTSLYAMVDTICIPFFIPLLGRWLTMPPPVIPNPVERFSDTYPNIISYNISCFGKEWPDEIEMYRPDRTQETASHRVSNHRTIIKQLVSSAMEYENLAVRWTDGADSMLALSFIEIADEVGFEKSTAVFIDHVYHLDEITEFIESRTDGGVEIIYA